MDGVDYLDYYNDEHYLLDKVGPRFRKTGNLEPSDFLMILVWKANRAVGHHIKRLQERGECSFNEAVSRIAQSLHSCTRPKEKLQLLITKWWFALPTATAILTILYPEEFTVYDVIVCEELKHKYRPQLYASDSPWEEYEAYQAKVLSTAPSELSLRDKDRWLTGHHYYEWLKKKELELGCASGA
jgi:hypothetical protein